MELDPAVLTECSHQRQVHLARLVSSHHKTPSLHIPCIVHVLPEPVDPYARMAALLPDMKASVADLPIKLNI